MSSLLGAAFSLVTFFWRPKESNQRKGPGYAAVPKIALHSVAQNKLAFRFLLLPGILDYLAALLCPNFLGRAQTVFCAATPFRPIF